MGKQIDIPYETNSEPATVSGFRCKSCFRFFIDDSSAKYCCSTSHACACGGRADKSRTACKVCCEKLAAEEWAAKESHEWDGEFPLSLDDDDKFFWNSEDLEDYILDNEICDSSGIRLTKCEKQVPRSFSMIDYLDDDIHEDSTIDHSDTEEIDKIVNDWISENVPDLFYGTRKKLDVDQVLKDLGISYFGNTPYTDDCNLPHTY
jgi:hypothetical protein